MGDACQGMGDYKEGGKAKQVKIPVHLDFKSLEESLTDPVFLESDFAKLDRPAQLHVFWQTLHIFVSKNGRLPKPRNEVEFRLIHSTLLYTDHEGKMFLEGWMDG